MNNATNDDKHIFMQKREMYYCNMLSSPLTTDDDSAQVAGAFFFKEVTWAKGHVARQLTSAADAELDLFSERLFSINYIDLNSDCIRSVNKDSNGPLSRD